MSHYKNENGNPVLKDSFCAALDVLGFSQKVLGEGGEEFFQEFVSISKKNKEKIVKFYDELKFKRLVEVASFSDNIALGAPVWSDDGESEFGRIVSDISYYQLSMALDGLFVRGGLSLGKLFMDEGMVYGPALIEAYQLESVDAIFPRVIISKEVERLIEKHVNYYHPKEDAPHNREIWRDADGHCFVNYLNWLIIDDDPVEGIVGWDELMTHKENIMKNMSENVGKYHIWLKYKWLSDYHNAFCDKLSNMMNWDELYYIPDELMRTYPVQFVQKA